MDPLPVCVCDRESVQQQSVELESLRAKLHLAETNLKSFETLAAERAHQISSLERDCKAREDRLTSLDQASSKKEERLREAEERVAAVTEKLSALKVEKERLIQQVHTHTHAHDSGFGIRGIGWY